jgi:hypothetical protein
VPMEYNRTFVTLVSEGESLGNCNSKHAGGGGGRGGSVHSVEKHELFKNSPSTETTFSIA